MAPFGPCNTAFALPLEEVGQDMVTASKLPVNTNASALDMAEAIFGEGVTVVK